MKLTQERLKELLSYDPDTGEFFRDGKLVGSNNGNGYKRITINGHKYYSHRLAWFYVYGYLPEHGIDHINRIKDDNQISNLREVSQSCNIRNANGRSNSTSGIKGVHKNHSNWVAQITVGSKTFHLGTFSTLFAAAKARVAAEEKYDFVTCNKLSEAKLFITENPDDGGEKLKRKTAIGIYWHKRDGKWQVRVKETYLGSYNTIEEAKEALNKCTY